MQQASGNQNRAAEILGLSRATLRAKLRGMNLAVEKVVAARQDDPPEEH
jgi:DNA-binding NtrC family response regulator